MSVNMEVDQWETWKEIHSQPNIWKAWGKSFDPAPLQKWIAELDIDEVWFCGAGTSAYIGDAIVAGLEGEDSCVLRSIPSTDLVARPHAYLNKKKPLIVSFGRSGNSTETIGTLDALDALAPKAPRLHITCHAKSALAQRTTAGPLQIILLPEETHDQGFAMTSSYSTMYYTALAIFDGCTDFSARMSNLASHLEHMLPVFTQKAGHRSARCVFLGTGALGAAAKEAALKVLELTAGESAVMSETPLGFRHGPKSFVNEQTLINIFLSPIGYERHYEVDLINELKAQFPKARIQSIGDGGDIDVKAAYGARWSVPIYVAFAQILAVHWAQSLGFNVDNPFEGEGTLSRVVEGVKLYPVLP